MKYVRQFCIILVFSFLGEILHTLIPLPIPASVYGLVLLLIALCVKIVKVEQVKEASKFLIEIMPVMFIPAAAGLLTGSCLLLPSLWLSLSLANECSFLYATKALYMP